MGTKNFNNIKDGFRRNKKSEQANLHSITQVNEIEAPNKIDELPLINFNENKPVKMFYLSQNKREKNNNNESEKGQMNNIPMLKSEKSK